MKWEWFLPPCCGARTLGVLSKPQRGKTNLNAAIIRALQGVALTLFLKPVALHPLLALGIAFALAYAVSLTGFWVPG